MATKSLKYNAGLNLRQAEFVETGEHTPIERELKISLETPDERAAWVACFGLSDKGDMTNKHASHLNNVVKYLNIDLTVDEPLTQEQAIAYMKQWAEVVKVKAEEKAKEEAEKEAKAKREREQIEAIRAEFSPLSNTNQYEEIMRRTEQPRDLEYKAEREFKAYRDGAKEALEKIAQDAKLAERKAAKLAWIEANGSEHLKLCVQKGYNSQRLYLQERAAQEAPGYSLDMGKKLTFKDRSSPSPKAMTELLNAEKFGIGEAEIVWHEWEDEEYEGAGYGEENACEAVIIYDYHGDNFLYKLVK